MTLYRVSWIVWIVGTVLILLSWTNTVPSMVGWVGFGLALAGTLVSFFPHLGGKKKP